MDELNEILMTISDKLISAAQQILIIRVLSEKEQLEESVIARGMEENSTSKVNYIANTSERLIEGDIWHSQPYSAEHFNAGVLTKDWSNIKVEDKAELVNIENDCRSLALVTRLWVNEMEKGKQPVGDRRNLCLASYELYGVANRALGHWVSKIEILLKTTTAGNLKKKLQKEKYIDDIATLLSFHGDKATDPFMKEVKELTGRSDSRIREYIQDAKKLRKQQDNFVKEFRSKLTATGEPNSRIHEYLQDAKAAGKSPEETIKEFFEKIKATGDTET
jgi:hypothetical protein